MTAFLYIPPNFKLSANGNGQKVSILIININLWRDLKLKILYQAPQIQMLRLRPYFYMDMGDTLVEIIYCLLLTRRWQYLDLYGI